VSLTPALDASVVICAYTQDRWDDLLTAIESVAVQRPPPAEILVVIDHEPMLAERLRDEDLDQVRVLENVHARGLSGARNTGVGAATRELVAFLDDDARAEPGWLSGLLAAFDDPAVVGTGGTIEPGWDTRRPRWFAPELDWIVGCTYRGMARGRSDIRNPIGASMAFRTDVLRRVGGFHAGVGRARRLPVGGEETELAIRIGRTAPGARIVFEPASRVRHRVPRSRATFRYALIRSMAEGVTKARVSRLQGAGASLSSERRYAMRTLPAAARREMRAAVAHADVFAALRAGVIAASVAAATVGFAAGWLQSMVRFPGLRFRSPILGTPRGAGATNTSAKAAASADGTSTQRRLRILQVTPRFAPFAGGVETHTQEVARRLAERGHLVTVATTDPDGSLPRLDRQDGVEIRRVRAWPRDRDWYFAPGLLPIVARGRWDIVHLQGAHTLVPPVGALGGLLGRRRMVLTFHSGGHSSAIRTAMRPVQWALMAPLLRRVRNLVGVSRFEADRFAKTLGVSRSRFAVIPNGSDLPNAREVLDRARSSTAIDGEPLLLSFGRLERYKGHHRVLAAMPAILAARPGARLRIAGAGPYEGSLRAQAQRLGVGDRVEIGPVERTALGALLDRADLVLLLSEYESQGIAVMEALAHGRPVLVADTSGLSELADRGLVDGIDIASSSEAVARAVLDALDRPRDATSTPDLPTWDDTVDALEKLYRRVVAG
jgi:glycosyltransferase involved in cell wall biosynthesis/GT2 family glycosyltransferase